MTEFHNCPEEFRENCTFYEIKCHQCRAFEQTLSQMHYKPISKDPELGFKQHPCRIEDQRQQKQRKLETSRERKSSQSFKRAQRNTRTGLKTERKVLEKFDARSTVGSGRVFGDGDGYLVCPDGSKWFVEHKTRIANRHTLGPTAAEWEKAQQQGAELFMVTSDTHGTIVTMSEKTFKELLAILNAD